MLKNNKFETKRDLLKAFIDVERAYIKQKSLEADLDFSPRDPETHRFQAIRDIYDTYKKRADEIYHRHKDTVWIKKDGYLPTGWMLKDKGVMEMCRRTKFIQVFNYIDSLVMPRTGKDIDDLLLKLIGTTEGILWKGKRRRPAMFFINKHVFEDVERNLWIKKTTFQAYLRKFHHLNILHKKEDAIGRANIYFIGYWHEFSNGKWRVLRFFSKDMPGLKALREFKVRG